MTLIKHKGLGLSVELKDITQRDLERFSIKRREADLDPNILTLSEYTGAIIRIASELDFFSEQLDIDDWKPARVIYLHKEMARLIIEAVAIPPE